MLTVLFSPCRTKSCIHPFSASIFGFLGTLISLDFLEHSSCSLCLTKLCYYGMSSNLISLLATVLCITMHNILLSMRLFLQYYKCKNGGYERSSACVDYQLDITVLHVYFVLVLGTGLYRGGLMVQGRL